MPPQITYQHDSDSHPPVVREQDIETDFVEELRSLKYEYRPDIRRLGLEGIEGPEKIWPPN
jgi:hypothetical protein